MKSLRRSGCPSAQGLEEHLVGLVDHTRHLSQCVECAAYVATLSSEQAAFFKARPTEQLLRKLKARRAPRPRVRQAFLVSALAASLVALVVALRPTPGIVMKGSGWFTVFAKHQQADPQPVTNGQRLEPGDSLRFAVSSDRDAYLLILNLDANGTVVSFYPYGEAASAALVAGEKALLPGAVVLDASMGQEWLIAVRSEQPVTVEAMRAQLKTRAPPELFCRGCQVAALRIHKAP